MEQPFSVALAAAEGAPLARDLCFGHLWCVCPLYAGCFLGLHLALWLLYDWERGIALTARPHWWQCFGTASAALSARMPLVRLDFPARPHDRLPTCPTSYLLWAKFSNSCFGLCRLPTSPRIALPPIYILHLCSRFHPYLLFFLCEFNSSPSFVTFFYYFLLMADSLLAKLGDLTFTAEEQDAIVVAPDSEAIPAEDFACSLVGKVVSPPTVDGGRLIRQFLSIWKDDKILTISKINLNFFLISFASPANRANVLKRGPWDFQKYWFALEQADPNRTIHDYSFLHMFIWVCIHNIPLSLMMAALARVLGSSIRKVIMTDTHLEDGNMGEFMRVRVLIDTSKPLRRCVVVSRLDAKASMCLLQYERLPLFCHGCGLIGHPVLACPITPKAEGQKFQYGAWLRAPLPKRSATRPRGQLSIVDDDLGIPVSAWLFWRRAWPTGWTSYFVVVDSMDGVATAWCASKGMSVPPLVSVVAAALAEGFTLSRLVTIAGGVVGRLAWCQSLFSWCASTALSMFCSLFLGFVWPRVIPFSWPASRSAVTTFRAEWSKERPLWLSHAAGSALGLLVVAKGAPSARPSCLGSARPWWASWLLGSHLWVLASWLISGCWLCLGASLGPAVLVVKSWGRWPLPRAPPGS
ncbi:hypothetical protein GQ457_10G010640 [Hibiscus cannabinus]